MFKVKICGLTRLCDIDTVNMENPDYIGFVFANSRRRVSPSQAMKLKERLNEGIISVGVFVDERIEVVLSIIKSGIVDIIQLHGAENENYIKRLKEISGKPVIKAVSVEKADDVQKLASTSADYLLLDNKGGGTGRAFDWGLIGETDKPYFLAGGLDVDNIAQAISQTRPYVFDVSSGVETDGLKDPVKIKEFIRRVRNA